ncbi:phenylalanine--tRNA ligase subunit beta [Oceanibacterium hippocampi]|uniref:Phenylalanine--tRNA ligase beta subunit n=1 Tax=Oceanibacterium hippocampi TaxID=745714 RepID=A0A1Y5RVE9_9PROT|nr:phenylalanine--tRNA ligase subunit beta [Oceanibacterium hippocampi]SLN23692.1 Phenylalanine--tRNA ligase beta subunit [Oceanibacterium hippocampi]
MKFTLGWLKSHLETDATLDEIVLKLTELGLEVEDVRDPGAELAPFTIAHVIEAKQHPDADRLRVCTVDTGSGTVQVVCGAPNARTGMKGVFAASGLTIPGTGLLLKPSKIRGVESNGMLVSEREMGMSDEHDGIIELADDAPVGQPFAAYAGLDDPVIDVAITPNRQDALGVHGIARDLAAAGLGRLKPVEATPIPGRYQSPVSVRHELAPGQADVSPLFVGRHVRGVKNGPSPKWLQDRLRAIGLRPISALVDITNFVTFDLGRPLHVFDADRLSGGIHVRLGRAGERFLALNGEEYAVDGTMCVIADDSGALGLGGIIGGESTGCTEGTVNVFIESALFDPIRTAMTGRKLGIESDARYRFERGVDPAFARPGMEVATRLVMELCGGEPSELVISGAEPDWQRRVTLRPERLAALTGIAMSESEMVAILGKLGFTVAADGGALLVDVPSWRQDVSIEADLIEDLARVRGYDAIPAAPLPRLSVVARPALSLAQRRVRIARRALAARGLMEAVTWSFLPRAQAALFGGGGDDLLLANPISSDLDCMRPSLLPNLLTAAGRNADRGFADTALFEIAADYQGDRPEDQRRVAAGMRRGREGERHWAEAARAVDAFDAQADALAVLEAAGAPVGNLRIVADAPDWYHPGRSGRIMLGPKTCLGQFGEIHPGVLEALDVKGPAVGFEVFLDQIPVPKAKGKTRRPPLRVSDFQPVERDFAFLVDRDVASGDLVRAAAGADKALIEDVRVFDLYQGDRMPDGKKSLAIAVRLAPKDRTLTDAEIDAVGQKIVDAVAKATGATLRG